jgi:DNA-directed RNA polymerase II subunit RPB1
MSNFSSNLENIKDLTIINEIQFGIMSPDEIRKGSVCEILSTNTFNGDDPVINGLFDPRMGQLERGNICATCENTYDICPGHFGHIELALPVYNIHYFDIVKKVLNCICFKCSTILLDKTDLEKMKKINELNNSKRLSKMKELTANVKQCKYNNGCNVLLPKSYSSMSSTNTTLTITAVFNEEALVSQSLSKKQIISPLLCSEIFKRISEEDCELLGFSNKYSRPEWMICSVLPICPPSVRPSVLQNNQRSEDDLSYFLHLIIQANERLKKEIEISRYIDENFNMLQYTTIVYINNSKAGILTRAHRNRRSLKSLKERIAPKVGRIRGNLMGKRVDYSARTVITGDPCISIDEFGIPMKIAMNMTFPEIVTIYNIDEMYKLVRNGPTKYPGAKTIKKYENIESDKPEPYVIDLKYVDINNIILNYGDIINRHLLDGDWVLCNRQPSLHKMSMMGHRARILSGNTFRLNVSATSPYNADFDGDELNMHIPQSYLTAYELENNASVSENIINPASSKPVMKLVQDTVIGSYLMTDDKTTDITEKQMYNYLMRSKTFNGILPTNKKTENWTGKDLYSQITQNITLKSGDVEIKNGILHKGIIGSRVIGSGGGGLIHTIHNQYNKESCITFLNDCQDVVTRWLETNSFSIGYIDTQINMSIKNEIEKITEKYVQKSTDLINKINLNDYHPLLDMKLRLRLFEDEMSKIAQDITNKIDELIFVNISKENNIYKAIDSGSKGKKINLVQILGGLGQQSIDNNRISFAFTDRTLPYFHKNDYSLESRGFCKKSYTDGSNMVEFFYHAIAGRNGMIDTSLKTADTGYTQRKLIKLMEDMKIGYNNCVQNEKENIIQFYYGGDSFQPIHLEKCYLYLIEYDNFNLKKKYLITEIDEKELSKQIISERNIYLNQYDEIIKARDDLQKIYFKNIEQISDCKFLSPLNLKRLIDMITSKNEFDNDTTVVSPKYIVKSFNEIYKYVTTMYSAEVLTFLKIQILQDLSIKQCVCVYKFSKKVFDFVAISIKNKILKAFIEPGEMVGCISAQSIVEPLTQMTLNTFHLAGVAAGSVSTTQGVPRFNEIINYSDSQSIKTPSVSIFPANDTIDIMNIKNDFEYIILKDLIKKTQIIYDSDNSKSCSEEELEYLNLYNDFNEILGLENFENLSAWVLNIEFDINSIIDKKITISEIQEILLNSFDSLDIIQCLISDDNNSNMSMRIRIVSDNNMDNYYEFMKEFETQIVEIKIRGIKNIESMSPSEKDIIEFHEDGSNTTKNVKYLETSGSNFIEILNNELVDPFLTTTNNISEIYKTFGIEAARNAIIYELNSVFDNGDVSQRHIELLVDAMTYKGSIHSVRRQSIKKNDDYGPLAKASFEEPLARLVEASMIGAVDEINGVSAGIALGQVSQYGTNFFDIIYDESFYFQENEDEDEDGDKEEEGDEDEDENEYKLYDEINAIHNTNSPENEINDNSFNFGFMCGNEYDIGGFIPPSIDFNSNNENKVSNNSNNENEVSNNSNNENENEVSNNSNNENENEVSNNSNNENENEVSNNSNNENEVSNNSNNENENEVSNNSNNENEVSNNSNNENEEEVFNNNVKNSKNKKKNKTIKIKIKKM